MTPPTPIDPRRLKPNSPFIVIQVLGNVAWDITEEAWDKAVAKGEDMRLSELINRVAGEDAIVAEGFGDA